MKTCASCKQELELENFCKKTKSPDGYSYHCRQCASEKAKSYYHNNLEVKAQIINRKKQSVIEKKIWIYDYLLAHPCIDCGEGRPECLDFDHQRDKFMGICKMVDANYSLKSIQEEIAKCEIRCANCHRVRTAQQLGWYAWYPRLDSNQH